MASHHNIDIAGGIRIIEWLRCELLSSVAELGRLMLAGARAGQDALSDVLANIVMVTYLLGQRLGIPFDGIDRKVMAKVRLGILEEHEMEKGGDLSALGEYIGKRDKEA